MPMRRCWFVILFMTLSAVISFADEGQIKRDYMNAIQAMTDGKLDEAEAGLKKVFDVSSRETNREYQSRSLYFLAEIAFVRKDYPKAVQLYRTTAERYSGQSVYSRSLYKLGRTLVMMDRPKEGRLILEDYLTRYEALDGLGDSATYWSARAMIAEKDYRSAYQTLTVLLQKYPSTPLSYEVRSNLKQIESDIEREKQAQIARETNSLEYYQKKSESAAYERSLLDKLSELLAIKQRLLEIRAAKLELLEEMQGGTEE